MFKRPGEQHENNDDGDLNLEQTVNLKLRELLEKKKADDLEGASDRTRGHAARVLRPRLDELREMVVYGLSMREITDLLKDGGVLIHYHSLRGFLKKHLPREYAEYIESKKPGDPYFGREVPQDVLDKHAPKVEANQQPTSTPQVKATKKAVTPEPAAPQVEANHKEEKQVGANKLAALDFEAATTHKPFDLKHKP